MTTAQLPAIPAPHCVASPGVLEHVGHLIEQEGEEWVNLGLVAQIAGGCGDPDGIFRDAERRGIELASPSGSGWHSCRVRDLPALVGESLARSVAAAQRRHGIEFVAASVGLQYCPGVSPGELVGLAERRRVLVNRSSGGNPRMSRSGLVALGRLLVRERAASPVLGELERRRLERLGEPLGDDDDWFPGAEAMPLLRRAMRTYASPGADAIDQSDRDKPRENPDWELVHRAGMLGIRWARERAGKWAAGRVRLWGFDSYRLAGIVLPGMNIDRYEELLAQAYRDETGREPPAA